MSKPLKPNFMRMTKKVIDPNARELFSQLWDFIDNIDWEEEIIETKDEPININDIEDEELEDE